MMISLTTAMAHRSAPRTRPKQLGGLLFSLLGSLTLAGCGSDISGWRKFPRVLYLTIGTNVDQTMDAQLQRDIQDRLNILEKGYRQLAPSVRFQVSLYPEARISGVMKRRTRAGLGPDLLLLNGDTAMRLYEAGLVDPFSLTAEERRRFNQDELSRLDLPGGDLVGLPMLEQTQLACFNRDRLKKPPTTLDELLQFSASGHPMGLAVDITNVFWTAGSLGALPGINQAASGRSPNPEQREAIVRWLAWLQNASAQQRITFYGDQNATLEEFAAGRLDWIPCQSVAVPRLRKQLGRAVEVSTLPRGDGGEPSPINRLRVLALGRSSSPNGRRAALGFSRFATNPLTQRNLTLGSQTVLPANRFVKVPVQSSKTLQSMEIASDQGRQVNTLFQLIHADDPRLSSVQGLLNGLVFGERSPNATATAMIELLVEKR